MGETKGVVVVTGAGGFIGGNLIAALRNRGVQGIRAVDSKPFDQWYQRFEDIENLSLDLNLKENCESVVRDASDVYNLAANMGGMGFIEHNKALCMLSVLINTHMLQGAVRHGVKRFFYASSACVYNTLIKKCLNWEPNTPLRVGLEKTYHWIYDQYRALELGEKGVVREAAASR